MNLPEICEPLFKYICCLNRIAKTRQDIDLAQVRIDIKQCLASIAENAARIPGMDEQYKKVELPLVFFVDSIIIESAIPTAQNWHRLAADHKALSGDQKFFDLLDDTLHDNSLEANERLAIFYICIGLGFKGWYHAQPEYLRKQMRILEPRIAGVMPQGHSTLITPDAYKYTNNANLPLPVSASIMPLIIGLAALFILVGVVNYYLFDRASEELQESLATIEAKDPVRAVSTPPASENKN
jgi:type VI protein secretion system component VasF